MLEALFSSNKAAKVGDPFSQSAEINMWDRIVAGFLLFMAGMVGSAIILQDWDKLSAFMGLFIVFMGSVGGVLIPWIENDRARNVAVDQCLTLAGEIGLSLSPSQAVELDRASNAGEVFTKFVDLIPKERLESKEFLRASSGESWGKACRQLVAFLHTNPSAVKA